MDKFYSMKKIALTLLIALTLTNVFAINKGSFDATIKFNGANRVLALYVPNNYDSTVKYRLMVCLHGLGDNIDNYRGALVSLGWPANIPNTIFVCPEAYNTSQDFYTPAGDDSVIQASINYAARNYNIDQNNIILQGFSIGGRAALRYGLDHPSQFKGLLLNTPAVQGIKEALNNRKSFTFNYANASKIPIYITHGETDAAYEGPVDTAFRQLVLNNGKAWYFEFPGLGHSIPAINKIINFISFFNNPATSGHNLDIQGIIVAPRTCNASVSPQVLIRSTGGAYINAVTFEYSINNGAPQTYTWTPQLATLGSFEYKLITLPSLTAIPGKSTINVKVKFLNNTVTDSDSVFSANRKSASFQYVDKGIALPLLETFNGPTVPPANWLAQPQGEVWTPWFIDSTVHEKGGYASMGAINTIIGVFDNSGRSEGMLTPIMDLTSTSNPGLKFDVAYNYEHYTAAYVGVDTMLADTLEVLISTDCGDTWHSVFKKGGKQLASFHDPILNPTTIQAVIIVPKDSNWRIEEINLNAYAGAKEAIVKFNYISGRGGSIYIDNMALSTYLGIKLIADIQSLQIFPNPASDKVNIVTSDENITRVNVMDVSGKTVISISEESSLGSTLSVNTSALPKGLYFFQVFTNKGVNTSKVVLN